MKTPPLPPAPVQYAAGPFAKVGGVRAHMVVHSIQVERNSYNCLGLSFPPLPPAAPVLNVRNRLHQRVRLECI